MFVVFINHLRLWVAHMPRFSVANVHLPRIVNSGCADEVWIVPCGPRPDKPHLCLDDDDERLVGGDWNMFVHINDGSI